MNSQKLIALGVSVFLFLSGCAFHKTDIKNSELLHKKTTIFIYGYEDNLKIKEIVKTELTKRGYIVTDKKSDAQLIADYNYRCYYDVFHYTCLQFYFFISDKETGEIILGSKFGGDTPWSAETLLHDMFKRIDDKLK